MARVITFSRKFPSYHPKAGQPTFFVEKFLRSRYGQEPTEQYEYILFDCNKVDVKDAQHPMWQFFFRLDWSPKHEPKHHTIRAGKRWKVGDKFSPRVWSGKPYNSKQIIIAPDVEVKKVWDFAIDRHGRAIINSQARTALLTDIAKNDGLELHDLFLWFKYPKPFDGQIICWNENINY